MSRLLLATSVAVLLAGGPAFAAAPILALLLHGGGDLSLLPLSHCFFNRQIFAHRNWHTSEPLRTFICSSSQNETSMWSLAQ
ncbi:hypothetical protein X743_13385 [Mesorhizobium sp. LNHC252B00]|nr:hypothetical protein X743_13385 [Mesorhizobium sp. LNHC252B00]